MTASWRKPRTQLCRKWSARTRQLLPQLAPRPVGSFHQESALALHCVRPALGSREWRNRRFFHANRLKTLPRTMISCYKLNPTAWATPSLTEIRQRFALLWWEFAGIYDKFLIVHVDEQSQGRLPCAFISWVGAEERGQGRHSAEVFARWKCSQASQLSCSPWQRRPSLDSLSRRQRWWWRWHRGRLNLAAGMKSVPLHVPFMKWINAIDNGLL